MRNLFTSHAIKQDSAILSVSGLGKRHIQVLAHYLDQAKSELEKDQIALSTGRDPITGEAIDRVIVEANARCQKARIAWLEKELA